MYTVFRVFIGLLFMFHGGQKLFGWFNSESATFAGKVFGVQFINEMWIAGFIEFFGGILIAVGLFTIISAAISALLMVLAYMKAHVLSDMAEKTFSVMALPILNRGELAVVYLLAFLLIFFAGPGKYSLDKLWCKKCAGKKK